MMILNGLTLGLFTPRPDVASADKDREPQKKAAQIEIGRKISDGDDRDDRPNAFLPFTTAFRPFL